MVQLTVCSYHVTYAFQSESTLYHCLHVKELLVQNRLEIGSLSDCNWTRTHNHLLRKRTLLPVLSKEFRDIQTAIEFLFTLKRVRDMIRTCSQMQSTNNDTQHRSVSWPVWLNGWIHSETGTAHCKNKQMYRTDKFSKHHSIIWPIWLYGSLRTKWLWVRVPLQS